MASKSDKDKKNIKKSAPQSPKENSGKSTAKSKKQVDDDDEDEDDDLSVAKTSSKKTAAPSSKSKKEEDEEDDFDGEEDEVDEWDKVEEEEWDPDFDEFDVPKSKAKKGSTSPAKKTGKGGDDLEFDEDFKDLDLFGEDSFDEEEEDDF